MEYQEYIAPSKLKRRKSIPAVSTLLLLGDEHVVCSHRYGFSCLASKKQLKNTDCTWKPQEWTYASLTLRERYPFIDICNIARLCYIFVVLLQKRLSRYKIYYNLFLYI